MAVRVSAPANDVGHQISYRSASPLRHNRMAPALIVAVTDTTSTTWYHCRTISISARGLLPLPLRLLSLPSPIIVQAEPIQQAPLLQRSVSHRIDTSFHQHLLS